MSNTKNFYENIDREVYSAYTAPETHGAHKYIKKFIDDYNLTGKKCLEIGSSKGLYQDIVKDYTGLDIAISLKKYYHKPFFVINEDGTYPFEDNTFDAIWSYAVHEHIPDLNLALLELKRVLKKDGVIFFWPAWFCSTWAAEGYAVRPYSDFKLKGKLIKASIPIRKSIFWRSLFTFPKRIYNHLLFCLGKEHKKMCVKKLKANYNHFWVSDSDACNNMDPHDALLWFESNGFTCLSHPMHLKAFLVRHRPIILKKL